MSAREDNLAAVAIAAATADADVSGVPAGEYEIRAGVQACVNGFQAKIGTHGRLTIGRQVRSFDDVLATAVAVLLTELGGRAAGVVESLPASILHGDTATAAATRRARTLLRRLRKLTGVSWRATPSYKPRY